MRSDDIEVRIQSCNSGGARLLLYKTARTDMDILDETFGMMNWQKSYQMIGNQLFCTIEIWDEDKKQWIKKQDVGVESNIEAEKGRASDSQKRAGFVVGIGRELYSSPEMFVYAKDLETFKANSKGGYVCYDKFIVQDIRYDDRKIAYVAIRNMETNKVIEFGRIPKTKPEGDYIDVKQTATLRGFLQSRNFDEEKALQAVGLKDFSKVTRAQYNQIVRLVGGK